MAGLPLPIGIDETLTSIARGIGEAARLIPTLSRSEIGAVAVKTARVKIDFEMARTAAGSRSGVELGIRTFGVGATQTRSATLNESRNRGTIEFEIVAITDTARLPPAPPPRKPRPPSLAVRRTEIVKVLDLLREPKSTPALDTAARRALLAAVRAIEAMVADKRIDEAAAALEAVRSRFFDAPPQAGGER